MALSVSFVEALPFTDPKHDNQHKYVMVGTRSTSDVQEWDCAYLMQRTQALLHHGASKSSSDVSQEQQGPH
eukprot:13645-Eustigmatos_ZCMA.PRE.1